MKLTDSMNTYNPALTIIKEKGYVLTIQDLEDDDFNWVASKEGIELIANNPLRLLALVVIAEEKGENWNVCSNNLYDDILAEFGANKTILYGCKR